MNKAGISLIVLLFLLSAVNPALCKAGAAETEGYLTADAAEMEGSLTTARSQSPAISIEKALVESGLNLALSLFSLLRSLPFLLSSLLALISGDLGALLPSLQYFASLLLQPAYALTSLLPASITRDLLSLGLSIPSLISEWSGIITNTISLLSFIQALLPINVQNIVTSAASTISTLVPSAMLSAAGFITAAGTEISSLLASLGFGSLAGLVGALSSLPIDALEALGLTGVGMTVTGALSGILGALIGSTGGGGILGLIGAVGGGGILGALGTIIGGLVSLPTIGPILSSVLSPAFGAAGSILTWLSGEIISLSGIIVMQIPAIIGGLLGLSTGGTVSAVIVAVCEVIAAVLGAAGQVIAWAGGVLGGLAGVAAGVVAGEAAGAAVGGAGGAAVGAGAGAAVGGAGGAAVGAGAGAAVGGAGGAAVGAAPGGLGGLIASIPTSLLTTLGLSVGQGGLVLTGGGILGTIISLIPGAGSIISAILGVLSDLGLSGALVLLQKGATIAAPAINSISGLLLPSAPALLSETLLEANDIAMNIIGRSFALSLGPGGVLLGSPLLLRLLDFNPFIPYIPTITALLPAQLQFRIMTVINEILDLVVGRFSFIDQFALRTCVLIGSQYTQMLGLCLAPLLTLISLPFLGSYRLLVLPAEILKGALDGCFAGLLDAPLLFARAVSYWSAMLPRIINVPLKLLTAPLIFTKGWLTSFFAQPPVNLLMICIYPLLTVIQSLPAALDVLSSCIVALGSPLLIPAFCLLSPLLAPLVTLLPYALGVLKNIDQLVLQLLQLLNAIPALAQSFFILRMISAIIPLPFTTTIGCINTLYDLVHRLILLPLSLPGIEPAYQLFNLLIIPNGIINLCLSPVYTLLFTIGSTITGAMKVLCIPELVQILMLICMLPVLTCSFILQTPSRLFNNLKMLTAMIIAIDPADESTGSLPETETTEAAPKGPGVEEVLDRETVRQGGLTIGDVLSFLVGIGTNDITEEKIVEHIQQMNAIPAGDGQLQTVLSDFAKAGSVKKLIGIIGWIPIDVIADYLPKIAGNEMTQEDWESMGKDIVMFIGRKGLDYGLSYVLSSALGSAATGNVFVVIAAVTYSAVDLGVKAGTGRSITEWFQYNLDIKDRPYLDEMYEICKSTPPGEREKAIEIMTHEEDWKIMDPYVVRALYHIGTFMRESETFIDDWIKIENELQGKVSQSDTDMARRIIFDLYVGKDVSKEEMLFLHAVLSNLDENGDFASQRKKSELYYKGEIEKEALVVAIDRAQSLKGGEALLVNLESGESYYIYNTNMTVITEVTYYGLIPTHISTTNTTSRVVVLSVVDEVTLDPYEKDGVIYAQMSRKDLENGKLPVFSRNTKATYYGMGDNPSSPPVPGGEDITYSVERTFEAKVIDLTPHINDLKGSLKEEPAMILKNRSLISDQISGMMESDGE